jgi:hypothetical protein
MDDCFESCADSFGRMSNGKRCGLLTMCIGFVAIIVYVAVAIEGVEPTEFAIKRNNLSQDVDRVDILEGGLHWVGVFYSLIHFPSIHKSIEFSDDSTAQYKKLLTRTKEGLELEISFAFQYQLRKMDLPDMYLICQNDYEKIFARIARNAVLQAAGDFEASAYWLNRTKIGDTMKSDLTKYLDMAYTNISGFMLLKIDLPDVYEMAIVRTQVTNQEIITYNQTRVVNLTNQETENIKAVGLAKIQVINANASSYASQILNKGAGNVARQNIEYTSRSLMAV